MFQRTHAVLTAYSQLFKHITFKRTDNVQEIGVPLFKKVELLNQARVGEGQ